MYINYLQGFGSFHIRRRDWTFDDIDFTANTLHKKIMIGGEKIVKWHEDE